MNIKKYIVMAALVLLSVPSALAGDGETRVGLSAGVLWPGILNGTLHVDYETRYHNAWEVYVDAFTKWEECRDCGKVCRESFWKSNYGLGIGAAYKPAVHRSRNSVGRVRMGADIGTCDRSFSLGVELGYEYVWTFRNRMQFVLQQKNEITFWGKPTWRFGGLVGIRLPL